MTTTVLINCYNYEAFVGEAIRSVAAQTRRPDELIVVDDGSTDGSVAEIEEALAEAGFGRLVAKENGGQLSAFEAGLAEAAGDWIFFLDADDLYEPQHVETVRREIEAHPEGDFFFTDVVEFGDGDGEAFHYQGPEGDLAYSAMMVLAGIRVANTFVGGVTSCLCIRRRLLERIFPFGPHLAEDWRIRADNVLVYGTSFAGARKFHLAEKTVRYRLHGSNRFAGSKRNRVMNTRNMLATERLMGALELKVAYGSYAITGLGLEYRGIENKNGFIRQQYWKIVLRAPMGMMARLRIIGIMLKSEFTK